ncbi:hypothetical protein BDQ17DRAFT_1407677 [Cyathus striatus]|nr:hypothetical protein BDQ17DRAFT_1407677 [Cyathus striatus]
MIPQTLLSSLSLLLSFFLGGDPALTPTPTWCLQTSNALEQLTSCLDNFKIQLDEFNAITYQIAQPTPYQREAWSETVTSLLHLDGNCSAIPVPDSLKGIYTVTTFTESSGAEYCIFVETSIVCKAYLKGWGYMVVPGTRSAISRDIHLSAPHPGYDLGTVQQATSVFKSTGARTLLVPGRERTAYHAPSDCILPTTSKTVYYMTDPAHSTAEPFFDANIAIYNWQHASGGCPSASCAFIQLHGKGASTYGHSPSREWYQDETDRPVKRLKTELSTAFPPWNISLPSDTACILTATKNVIGRHINGVPLPGVCNTPAQASDATGEFVHIEQAIVSRDPKYFDTWSRVLKDTFATSCADGMTMDPQTKLCVVTRVGGGPKYLVLSPA